MTGNLYIDGTDAYELYRVFVTENGYKDIAAFPPLKKADSNDWAEEDGAEFDLSDPVLDTREITVGFAFHGDEERFSDFIEAISDGAYHDFSFCEIGKESRLRLVSQPNMSQVSTLGTFSLKFADDSPLYGYEYAEPQSSGIQRQGYELDGSDLSDYGVYVLKGSEIEVKKTPEVKKNLLTNLSTQSGAMYDDRDVVYKTKEVKLNCLMRADTLDGFWRNRNALLYDLTRPNERNLYVDKFGYSYKCYYKSCTASEFSPENKAWFKFTLTLVFTSFRFDGSDMLLATEDYDWIITEDTANPSRIRIRVLGGGRLANLATEDGAYVVTEEDEAKIYFN